MCMSVAVDKVCNEALEINRIEEKICKETN